MIALSYTFAAAYATDRIGLSIEIGAFLAGALLTALSRDVAGRALQRLCGLRDVLAALFFASMGLVVNWRFLLDNLPAILSVVVFVSLLKFSAVMLSLSIAASPAHFRLRSACILAHVGEFGFILAAKGSTWGALSRHVYLLLVGTNAISLCLAPWQFRFMEYWLPREDDSWASQQDASTDCKHSGVPWAAAPLAPVSRRWRLATRHGTG